MKNLIKKIKERINAKKKREMLENIKWANTLPRLDQVEMTRQIDKLDCRKEFQDQKKSVIKSGIELANSVSTLNSFKEEVDTYDLKDKFNIKMKTLLVQTIRSIHSLSGLDKIEESVFDLADPEVTFDFIIKTKTILLFTIEMAKNILFLIEIKERVECLNDDEVITLFKTKMSELS